MNIIPAHCTWCGIVIAVNQAEWKNPDAHICMKCTKHANAYNNYTDPDEEFELITEEEEDMINQLDWDDDPIATIKLKSGCECGADSVGSPWHSSWCPLYKDVMKK